LLDSLLQETRIMSSPDYLGYCYGAAVWAAGLGGFIKNRSAASFAIGSTFGGLALLGAYQASETPDEPLLATANSGGLALVLLGRNVLNYKKTGSVSVNTLVFVSMAMCARYSNNIYTGMSRSSTEIQK